MAYVGCNTAEIRARAELRASLAADVDAWLRAKETGEVAVSSLADPAQAAPKKGEPILKQKPDPERKTAPKSSVSPETARVNRLKDSGLIGIRVKLREAGVTQASLAARVGVSEQMMCQYLNGDTNVDSDLAGRIREAAEHICANPAENKAKLRRGIEWPQREEYVALMREHGIKATAVKHETGFPGSYTNDCITGRYNPSPERKPVIERAILKLVDDAKAGRKTKRLLPEPLKNTAARLRALRDEAGVRQCEICRAMNLPSSYISNVFGGRQEISDERVAEIEAVINKLRTK